MERNYKIYVLLDKNFPDEIRYVGLTRTSILILH